MLRAECQVCGADCAIDRHGRTSLHGYKRPGFGFIQGSCPAAKEPPLPAFNILEEIIPKVRAYAEEHEAKDADPNAQVRVSWRVRTGFGHHRQETHWMDVGAVWAFVQERMTERERLQAGLNSSLTAGQVCRRHTRDMHTWEARAARQQLEYLEPRLAQAKRETEVASV